MEKRINKTATCIFCGKVREYTVITDDGYDWHGHKRGQIRNDVCDKGCDCVLGKIEHEKTTIKKMCMNCRFYDGTNCTNEKELMEVSSFFDCGKKLLVKDSTKKCKYWELEIGIFKSLLNNKEMEK